MSSALSCAETTESVSPRCPNADKFPRLAAMADVSFQSLDLPEPVRKAIEELGFTQMTPVQQKALPIALAGNDVAAQGRTGTGKTAAFLIATFTRLLKKQPSKRRRPQDLRALVLAPTRELAVQIAKDAAKLGKYTNLKMHLVYGGVDLERQRKGFEGGVDLLIGTPGRVIDFYKQKAFSLRFLDVLVLDEADRMFDLGFIRDLRWLFRRMPPPSRRQTLLFSATLSFRVLELAYEHMNEAEILRAEEGSVAVERIEERVYFPADDEKISLLIGLLRREEVVRGIIFVNEKQTAEKVARALAQYGFAVGILSGNVRQKKRLRILEDFHTGKLKLLVATDVASRGLHIPGVSHVINYDLPDDPEAYVHRIGRTARAGATGVAISFACERYAWNLPPIEAYIQRQIPRAKITDELLDIGEPTHPDAVAEGQKGADRAAPSQSRKSGRKSSKRKRSRRQRKKGRPPRNEANAAKAKG